MYFEPASKSMHRLARGVGETIQGTRLSMLQGSLHSYPLTDETHHQVGAWGVHFQVRLYFHLSFSTARSNLRCVFKFVGTPCWVQRGYTSGFRHQAHLLAGLFGQLDDPAKSSLILPFPALFIFFDKIRPLFEPILVNSNSEIDFSGQQYKIELLDDLESRGVSDVEETQPKRKASRWWYLLVLPPLIGTLFPGMYFHASPELWGIPFFYWYQMLWVIISCITTGIMYAALKDS